MQRRDLLKAAGAGAIVSALPLRLARASTPPYNFATLSSTSQVKLFGGCIVNPPNWATPSGIDVNWVTMFQNFTTGTNIWTNWWQPQLKRLSEAGINHTRIVLGMQGVIAGTYTQGYMNACVSTMLADIKSRGMTVGVVAMGVPSFASVGSPSAATLWAVFKNLLDNVIVPNYLDVVAYVEPGGSECADHTGTGGANDMTVNNAVAGLMKAGGYVTPIGISATGFNTGAGNPYPNFSSYTSANYDVALPHIYPEQVPLTLVWDSARDMFYQTVKTANKPFLVEETGWGLDPTATDQNRADWVEYILMAAYGDPNCVGFTYWGDFGDPSEVNNWRLFSTPSPYNAAGMDPTKRWEDTVAGRVFASWGTPNRGQAFTTTLNTSQAITTSSTSVLTDFTTPIQHHTISNNVLGTKNWVASVPCSLIGTATITGDAGTTYTVQYVMHDFVTLADTVIGTASRVGSGTITLNISGAMPTGDITPLIKVIRGAGVNGTITALSAVIAYGNAPALNSPKATPLVL